MNRPSCPIEGIERFGSVECDLQDARCGIAHHCQGFKLPGHVGHLSRVLESKNPWKYLELLTRGKVRQDKGQQLRLQELQALPPPLRDGPPPPGGSHAAFSRQPPKTLNPKP